MHSMQMTTVVWTGAKQTSFANICETMGHFNKLAEFECGIVTGCRCCRKPVCDDCKVESMRNHNNPEVTEQVTERWGTFCVKVSADSITAQLQTSSGIKINRKTLCSEPNGIGLHGQAAPVNLAGDQSFGRLHIHTITITAEWAYHIPSYKPRNNDHSTSTKIKIHLSSFHCDH